jgi:DNA-binding NtrC family response regulator
MDSPIQILIVSSELENRRALNAILQKEGYETVCASRVSECPDALTQQNLDLIFCDRRLADGSYRDVVELARIAKNSVRVVVTSRLADWDEYLEALRHGAFDLIPSPCPPTDVMWAIIQARKENPERTGIASPARARAVAASTHAS